MPRIVLNAKDAEGKIDQLLKDVNRKQQEIQIVSECNRYGVVLVSVEKWEATQANLSAQADNENDGYVEIIEVDWESM